MSDDLNTQSDFQEPWTMGKEWLRAANREFRQNQILYAILGVVIIIGVAARLYMAFNWPLDLDEGYYLYDAKIAMQGLRPAFDYNSRSPLFHYLLGYVMEAFGYSLEVARSFVVATSIVTAVFIYLIGRNLFDNVVGVIAAAVFMLSPYFMYWNHIIKTEPFALMSASVLYWLFLRSLSFLEDRYGLFLVCTFLVGTIISLNHMIRASVLLYLPALFVLLIYRLRTDSDLNVDQMVVVIEFAAVLLASYTVSKTAFALTYDYPIQYALIQYRNPIAYALEHLGLLRSITGGSSSAANVGYITPEYTKLRVVFDWLLVAAHVVVPAAYGLIVLLHREKKREKAFLVGLSIVPFVLAILLIVGWSMPNIGGYNMTNMTSSHQVLLLLLALAISARLTKVIASVGELRNTERIIDINTRFAFLVLTLPAATILVAYLLKARLFVGYFVELAITLSILAAIIFTWLLRSVRAKLEEGNHHAVVTTLACLFIITSASFALVVYADPSTTTTDRQISKQSVNEAANYIQTNSDPSEEILTRQPTIAIQSNRQNAMDLSRSFNTYPQNPTPQEVVQYLKTHDVKFVVVTPRTKRKIAGELDTYVRNHYTEVKVIEDNTSGINKEIQILQRTDTLSSKGSNG